MTVLTALVVVVGYLAVGYRLAIWNIPKFVAAANEAWTIPRYRRESIRSRFSIMVLFWIIVVPVLAFSGRVDAVIDQHDPAAMQARLAERDERIAELERELGMQP